MLNFYKYQGAGNDFIMINNLDGSIKLEPEYIKKLCDRHFGIGADGLILIEASDKAHCFMNYYNADGTLAEMCGNGVRCTAKFFLSESNQINELEIDTRAGIKNIKVHEDGNFSVNMGAPIFNHSDFPSGSLNLLGYDFKFVSMGNPHAVTLVSQLDDIDIKDVGSKIETDQHFPNKINVEFVEKINDFYYKVKVWERGSGETLACGTGACAVYSILNLNKEITLEFPGGKLYLSQNESGEIILKGGAEMVYMGEI